jgi:hypothetical protein
VAINSNLCVCVAVLRFEFICTLPLEPLHRPYFCEGFFEKGSYKVFAQAGLEP